MKCNIMKILEVCLLSLKRWFPLVSDDKRSSGVQHFPFLPLEVSLALVLLSPFHLSLERPDHQEEVEPNPPAEDALDSASDVEGDEFLQDIDDVEEEADCSQTDEGLHEVDVPLKYKYKLDIYVVRKMIIKGFVCGEI